MARRDCWIVICATIVSEPSAGYENVTLEVNDNTVSVYNMKAINGTAADFGAIFQPNNTVCGGLAVTETKDPTSENATSGALTRGCPYRVSYYANCYYEGSNVVIGQQVTSDTYVCTGR